MTPGIALVPNRRVRLAARLRVASMNTLLEPEPMTAVSSADWIVTGAGRAG